MLTSLVGPNRFAKHRELRAITGSALQQRIYGEDGLSRWYAQLGQSDLFGQSPMLIAERIFEDLPKHDQDTLADYLTTQGAFTSDQHIIFLIEEDKQLAKNRLGSVLASHKLLRFPQPNAARLSMWVQQEAERLEVKISKSLIPRFVEKLGADQYALQTELERWSLHRPAEITAEVIQGLSPLASDADAFGLAMSWEQKNVTKTLSALTTLRLYGVVDQVIIGMLGWKVESLLLAGGQRLRGRSWPQEELEAALVSLYQLDLGIKRGKVDPVIGLELWLLETMGVDG